MSTGGLGGWLGRLMTGGAAQEPLDDVRTVVLAGKAALVDCRSQGEWDDGHLQHAVWLPVSEIKQASSFDGQLPKDKPIYVHCMAGVRAAQAARTLRKMGYDARPLSAGFAALAANGFPQAP